MIGALWKRGGKVLLFFMLMLRPVSVAADLLVETRGNGTEIVRLTIPEGTEGFVLWNHSVKGFPVSDCYEKQAGPMMLTYAHHSDFSAGLDRITSRCQKVTVGQQSFSIRDIHEPVPGDAFNLRPGTGVVNQRLQVGDTIVSLSAVAPRERGRIAITRN